MFACEEAGVVPDIICLSKALTGGTLPLAATVARAHVFAAFWSDDNSFEKGALAAVNLGDDTDTTAAIYGQLAGAHYTYSTLPQKWMEHLYARHFIECLSKWIVYEGNRWHSELS